MTRQALYRSRLSRRTEKQGKKTLFFSLLGIIAVLFFIFKVGLPLLIQFSVLVGDITQANQTVEEKNTSSFVPTPKLSFLPSATNSAQIDLEGITTREGDIEIYLNNELLTKRKTDSGGFTIEAIKLKEGQNIIKARLKTKEGDTSEFTKDIYVLYDRESPLIEINEPENNKTISKEEKSVVVSGKTEENVKITVNGIWVVIDTNGNFSYNLPVNSGENIISIEAIDQAGNKTTIERKIIVSE